MPRRKLQDPKTGDWIEYDWDFDTPPTVEEQELILADADGGGSDTQPGIGAGVVNEVVDTAKGLWNTVSDGSKYGAPGLLAQAGAGMASGTWDALKQTGSAIGDAVSNPSIAGAVDALGRVAATPADLVTGGGASRLIDAGQAGMAGDKEQAGRAIAMAGMAALPFAKPIMKALPKLGMPRTIDAPGMPPAAAPVAPPAAPRPVNFDTVVPVERPFRMPEFDPFESPNTAARGAEAIRANHQMGLGRPEPTITPVRPPQALGSLPVERPFRADVFEAEFGPAMQPTRTSEVAAYKTREIRDAVESSLPIERLDAYVADQLDRVGVPVERAVMQPDEAWMKALERDVPAPIINHAPQTAMRETINAALRGGTYHRYKQPAISPQAWSPADIAAELGKTRPASRSWPARTP